MPRKPTAGPAPKSRRLRSAGKPLNIAKSFLGDSSGLEEPGSESADLNQTDVGTDTNRVKSLQKTRGLNTSHEEEPIVSSTNRGTSTQNTISKTNSRRKQKTPVQLHKKFLVDVAKLQKSTDIQIPKAPFGRLIREILIRESTTADRLTVTALVALQEAAEMYLTTLFQDAYCCTLHRGRMTLSVKDIELTRFLRGVSDPGNR